MRFATKYALLFAVLASTGYGQISVTLTFTVPSSAAQSIERYRLSQTLGSTALTAPIDAVVTTIPVADSTGCAVPCQVMIESEALSVSAKTLTSLTVARGATITAAASHASGVNVTYLRDVNAQALCIRLLREAFANILESQPTPAIQAQIAAIQAAQAAIAAAKAAAIP